MEVERDGDVVIQQECQGGSRQGTDKGDLGSHRHAGVSKRQLA